MTPESPAAVPLTSVATDRGDVAGELSRLARVLAAAPDQECLLITAGLSLPAQALIDFADSPGQGTFALTAGTGPGADIRVAHGRIVAVSADRFREAGTATRCPGLLRVAPEDRSRAADALARAASDLRELAPKANPFAWVLRAVVRAGINVRAEPISPWPWDPHGAPVIVTDAEADRIRLTRANRSDDGWYSVTVLRRLSKPVTALAARRGWSPNAITTGSLVLGLAAAGAFAIGTFWALVIGAVLLQVSLVVDCADGEVARLTGRFSKTGAWLDAVTDRVKEYAAYAGLAAGVATATDGRSWWLAAALMILQTARHLTDYTFAEVQKAHETVDVAGPLLSVTSGGAARQTPAETAGITTMLRRTLFLPIGERWLLVSVGAVVLGAWWTLLLLFGLGVLSLAYAGAGRVRRTLVWQRGPVADRVIADQLDTALFGSARPGARIPPAAPVLLTVVAWLVAILAVAREWTGGSALALVVVAVLLVATPRDVAWLPFAWAIPAVLAVVEMTLWASAAFMTPAIVAPWVFTLLFAVAFHRYDLLYRAVGGRVQPRWLQALCGGVPVRLLILAGAVVTGTLASGTVVVAVYLLLVAVALASGQGLARS